MKKLVMFLIIGILLLSVSYAYSERKYQVFNFGTNKTMSNNIINSIDPTYFKDIKRISFIKSSNGWYRQGFYVPPGLIDVYVIPNTSEEYTRSKLLHELKHHYCWKTEKSLSHTGCFLNTPIDKEYGKII